MTRLSDAHRQYNFRKRRDAKAQRMETALREITEGLADTKTALGLRLKAIAEGALAVDHPTPKGVS